MSLIDAKSSQGMTAHCRTAYCRSARDMKLELVKVKLGFSELRLKTNGSGYSYVKIYSRQGFLNLKRVEYHICLWAIVFKALMFLSGIVLPAQNPKYT